MGFLDRVGIRDPPQQIVISSGSPTASASITSPTGCDSAPKRASISSTNPFGMIGSPIHCQ